MNAIAQLNVNMHIHGIQLVENIHYEEMVKTAPGIISDI
jgi:hypothetical protein